MFRQISLFSVLLFGMTGCGGTAGMAPVSGVVRYADGSNIADLEGGQVVFEGKAANGKPSMATGAIQADGRFTLTTLTRNDGAVLGPNRVLVTPPTESSDKPALRILDASLESFDTSGLSFEVQSGSNTFEIVVRRPAEKK